MKSSLSLAFHLPQFHPIEENDRWWGPGFTEWTDLTEAKRFWTGHEIRRPIGPFGQYSLLNSETLEWQSAIARQHGIDAFLVWDYWLGGGKRLLEKPIHKVLTENLDFRYALAWANHSWKNYERGVLLCEQKYLGVDDYSRYFESTLPHFESDHYVKIGDKPVFFILDPTAIPDGPAFFDLWRNLAIRAGFKGIYFMSDRLFGHEPIVAELDRISEGFHFWTFKKKLFLNLFKEQLKTKLNIVMPQPQRYDYWTMVKDCIPKNPHPKFTPTVITGWDTTPRHGARGVVFEGFNEKQFARHLNSIGEFIQNQVPAERIVLVKSWNEWAEGNLLEPDNLFGERLLKIYRDQFPPADYQN